MEITVKGTLEEATAEFNNQKHIWKNKQCPLFRKHCLRSGCVSYYMGNLVGKEGNYKIKTPKCTNALITGVVESK